ncbi:hypothetical protein AAMO2058_000037400 [Amorphochlora amoebiformis]
MTVGAASRRQLAGVFPLVRRRTRWFFSKGSDLDIFKGRGKEGRRRNCTMVDGRSIARRMIEDFKEEVKTFEERPCLCIIQVGDRKDSSMYVRNKCIAAEYIGMETLYIKLPVDVDESHLISEIKKRNLDPAVHGIIVQQPTPSSISVANIEAAIDPRKDVDAFHPSNQGLLMSQPNPPLVPCTALAVMRILDEVGLPLEGKRAVVMGRSKIAGAPIAALLRHRNMTVTVCHSKSQNTPEIARSADVLVVAIGQCELVDETYVKPGAVVVDVGIHLKKTSDRRFMNSRMDGFQALGDTKQTEIQKLASHLTPVPGGVGPLTVAMVLHNTIQCYKDHNTEKLSEISSGTEVNGSEDRIAGAYGWPGNKEMPRMVAEGRYPEIGSDSQINLAYKPRDVQDIAGDLGIDKKHIRLYGNHMAKIGLNTGANASLLHTLGNNRKSKYVAVSGMTPTKFGEGKTTTLLGLCQAFARKEIMSIGAIRQPSQGPTFGLKGGAAGGGMSQVAPITDMNLHLTGDIHAVMAANNLLAAQIDARVLHEKKLSDALLEKHLLGIETKEDDPPPGYGSQQLGPPAHMLRRIDRLGDATSALRLSVKDVLWRRVLDTNDRMLREIVIGAGLREQKAKRTTGFDMAAASEVMAIVSLSTSMEDLYKRLNNILAATDTNGRFLTADDFGAVGAMAALLKDAIEPTLMQTLEGSPVLVHGGPFANIAHGNSSIIADMIGLSLMEDHEGYVITEGGFGSDMGLEKFFHIKCNASGLSPDCVVIVGTVKAIRHHAQGGPLKEGCLNLAKHLDIARKFGVPAIAAINVHGSDSTDELDVVSRTMEELTGFPPIITSPYFEGGEGCMALAEAVEDACQASSGSHMPLYKTSDSFYKKMDTIAREVYGADGIEITDTAREKLAIFGGAGYDHLPICVAKTQYSLSHDPHLLNVPSGFTVPVRNLTLSGGAGFICAYLGDIQTMPGLPVRPALMDVDVDIDARGEVSVIGLR